MKLTGIRLGLCVLGAAALLTSHGVAQPKPAAKGQPAAKAGDDFDDLLEGKDQGTLFRLVDAAQPAADLGPRLYWRTLPGIVAAETTPIEFRLDGDDLIVPKLAQTGDEPSVAGDVYPIRGRLPLKDGKHVLSPGEIPVIVAGGKVQSEHPAIATAALKVGEEVRIRCAPVRLAAATADGVPLPMDIRVEHAGKPLLRKANAFSSLIVWLPVGLTYDTSLGSFQLDADGQIATAKLAKDVTRVGNTFRKTLPAPTPAARPRPLPDALIVRESELPEAQRPRVRVWVPPHVQPGEAAVVALSPKEFKAVAKRDFAEQKFGAKINYRGPGLDDERTTVSVVEAPSAELADQARRELQLQPGDAAVWLAVTIPAALHGPVQFTLEHPELTSVVTAVLVAELGNGLSLAPHRGRTDFAHTETGRYTVIVDPKHPGGAARILAETVGEKPRQIVLGTLDLPKTTADRDARGFDLLMADLPAGAYRIWVEGEGVRTGKVALRIVRWDHKSPFFVHSMSGCTACWPTTEEGLQLLQDAGLEMVSATGAWSQLNTDMPQVNGPLAARLAQHGFDVPDGVVLQPTCNDYLLSRLTRHQLRLIDLAVVRSAGMYTEGLSYHHSYGPSVDRMIRRMQVFTQQTADYASFYGVNYSWFPQMYGYAEGGVPTDAHVGERNRVLAERLKEAGIEPVSADDLKWYHEHKWSTDPQERKRALALMQQATTYWEESNARGWGDHNELYNVAIQEIRPGTACTLFENAGHDEGKRMREQFRTMNAVCYESYTDFGDWPLSAGFVTDWAHANSPGQPVWLTTCWGASSESKMKSLFHAFGRGLEGGGVPLQAIYDDSELTRRTTGMQFVGQYGAIALQAKPDRRVTILTRAATQALTPRGMWNYHAAYTYLTRLGCPPGIIADEELVAKGLADDVQALAIVQEEQPLEPELLDAVAKFQKRGGKVLVIGDTPVQIAGGIALNQPVKNLWQLGGFGRDSHAALWREFLTTWREPLAELLDQARIEPAASTDPEQGFVLTLDGGEILYAIVCADTKNTHADVFERTKGLPVSFAGTGWRVRDLARQETLESKTEGGRTIVDVDLLTEPTTVLALSKLPKAPVARVVRLSDRTKVSPTQSRYLGMKLSLEVASNGKSVIPFKLVLRGPDGAVRGTWFQSADYLVARHDTPGTWRTEVQELIDGQTVVQEFTVEPAVDIVPAVRRVPEVDVVNADHVRQFAAADGQKWIIVEPEQRHLLSTARKLADALTKKGASVRVWEVQSWQYDTAPVRWFPRPDDEARSSLIAAGELIGFRQNLQAYIDRSKRAHVPELGGYSDIAPAYVVAEDCILFSGGRLADSLSAVTPWLGATQSLGAAQGRIVTCFSPFVARQHAVVLAADDVEGLTKASGALVRLWGSERQQRHLASTKPGPTLIPFEPTEVSRQPALVPQPYRNFTPVERVQLLLANDDGRAVVVLRGEQDNVAFVDAAGKVTGTGFFEGLLPKTGAIDVEGRFSALVQEVLATHPAWHFPTEVGYHAIRFDAAARVERSQLVWQGATAHLPPDNLSGFVFSRDGEPLALSRRGGLLWRRGDAWQRYDDLPFARQRFEVVIPRMPVGVTVSPDERYLLATFETRPPFGAFSNPPLVPTAAETVLLDLETGARLWSLRDDDSSKPTYAVHGGFARVANGGQRTAFVDYHGTGFVVNRGGEIVFQEQVGPVEEHVTQRIGPLEGVGVWMSHDGATTLFAFRNRASILSGTERHDVEVSGLAGGAVAADGSRIFLSTRGGAVRACDAQGTEVWKATPGGVGPVLATTGANDLLVGTAAGELIRYDAAGQEAFRTNVAAAADESQHTSYSGKARIIMQAPAEATDPGTLTLAKQSLGAQEAARWKPVGKSATYAGLAFYPAGGPIELSVPAEVKDGIVHLVYRRPEGNQQLSVTVTGGGTSETFVLDLPTPTYRVLDLPVRGAKAKVSVQSKGPVEIAELSVWSVAWPSANLAYVRPAAENLGGDDEPASSKPKPAGDDLLDDIGAKPAKSAAVGKLKTCRIWQPNSDPDAIVGPWLKAPLDPIQIVDGKRFGKIAPFAQQQGNLQPTRGGFFTCDFGADQPLSLVATYDRATVQSEVCKNIAVFNQTGEVDHLSSGEVLGGVIENDQFWRLIPVSGKPRILGVHVFRAADVPVGLSEVEAYYSTGKKQPTEAVDDLLDK